MKKMFFLLLIFYYGGKPYSIYADPIIPQAVCDLTVEQKTKVDSFKVGEYYSYGALIIDKSSPMRIPFAAFNNRLKEVDTLFRQLQSGDSSGLITKNLELLKINFFPNDAPLIWVYRGSSVVDSSIFIDRIVNQDGTVSDIQKVIPKTTFYEIVGKTFGDMRPLSFNIENNAIYPKVSMRFFDRGYAYYLISLGNDIYILLKLKFDR